MKKGLFFAIIFQTLVLFSLLLFAYLPLYFGKEIRLKASGVDPRDIFLGNFVALRYEFNVIKSDEKYKQNEILYLSLKKENGIFKKDKISKNKPKNGIFLQGRVKSSFKRNINDKRYESFVEFGIEKYFTTQENAENLQKQLLEKNATITLKLLNTNARVVNLKVN